MYGSAFVGFINAEKPRYYSPTLAKIIGLSAAIFLQELAFRLNPEHNKNFYDGRLWVYNSYDQWAERLGFSAKTVQRAVAVLEQRKVLLVGKNPRAGWDRKNWYTIDFEELDRQIKDFLKKKEEEEKDKKQNKKAKNTREDASGQNGQMHSDTTNSSIGTTCPDASGHDDLYNNNNLSNMEEETTTTSESLKMKQNGSGRSSVDVKVEANVVECNALQSPLDNSADGSPIAPPAHEQRAIYAEIQQFGINLRGASELIKKFGLAICMETCMAIRKNLENGTVIDKSTFGYFEKIAEKKKNQMSTIAATEEIRAKKEAMLEEKRVKTEAANRAKYIDDQRFLALKYDEPGSTEALARLRDIAEGAVGWTDADRIQATEALEDVRTEPERAVARKELIKQTLITIAGSQEQYDHFLGQCRKER